MGTIPLVYEAVLAKGVLIQKDLHGTFTQSDP